MPSRFALILLVLAVILPATSTATAASDPPASPAAVASPPPTPESFLGHPVGADRKLADYGQIVRYFEALARSSDRVMLDTLGRSTLGRPLVMAVVSSAANLRQADRWPKITRQLADPRGITPDAADVLIAQGKVVLLVTCSIHSTEIGASQMSMEWAHALATSTDPKVQRWL